MLGGILRGWNFRWVEFSWVEFSWVEFSLGGIFVGGIFVGGIFVGGIFLEPFFTANTMFYKFIQSLFGRRKEPVLGYVPKNDEKKNLVHKELKKMKISKLH